MSEVHIHPSWKEHLREEFDKPYFKELVTFVKNEYATQTIYPEGKNIFRAFERCPFDQVKVVILGQDPYHGPDQANGLCFSVNEDVRHPPSLQNIFKEIQAELGHPIPESGNLDRWADQGVLLLNATLTVRAKQAGSHQKKGWEEFTDAVTKVLNDNKEGIVFLLWGRYAQNKGAFIDRQKHHVFESAHPSPFSAHSGFFGNQHFIKTNEVLTTLGKSPINWS